MLRSRTATPVQESGSRSFCVVAGGGTAGHLLPGLAIARALVDRGHPTEAVHFVASEREIDVTIVGSSGFSMTALPGRGIERRPTLRNLAAISGLLRAQVRAYRLLRELRPRVVLVVGGYASVACTVAALLLRIPLVVTEQNARAGLANRVAGRFARACAVPFADTDLPGGIVTGNPVRVEVRPVDEAARAAARRELGIPQDRLVVLAFAGSLGARRINDAVAALARTWAHRDDLAIRHVVGHRDWDVVTSSATDPCDQKQGLCYQAVRYEERMHLALAAADVAICRSGGTTVAELAVVGLPSVLVPLPQAPRDHQTANASELVEAGAARLVPDAELDAHRLERELGAILDRPGQLEEMRRAAARLGRPDAAARVADLLEEHAR